MEDLRRQLISIRNACDVAIFTLESQLGMAAGGKDTERSRHLALTCRANYFELSPPPSATSSRPARRSNSELDKLNVEISAYFHAEQAKGRKVTRTDIANKFNLNIHTAVAMLRRARLNLNAQRSQNWRCRSKKNEINCEDSLENATRRSVRTSCKRVSDVRV